METSIAALGRNDGSERAGRTVTVASFADGIWRRVVQPDVVPADETAGPERGRRRRRQGD